MKSTGLVFKSRDYIRSAEPPATVLEDEIRGHHGSMTTGKPDLVRHSSGLWVFSYNGTDAVVDVGDLERNVRGICLWIYPDDNTERSILDLDAGTHSLELDASGDLTATGWTSPTRYVNALVANAVAQSAWSFIAVTTATAIDPSDVDLGKEASFFDGYQAKYKMFEYPPSKELLQAIYQDEKRWFGG